jgi:phytanoyl-CoA hydroxylase
MNDIKAFFDENGYYLARGVFAPDEIRALEDDFDRIVAQLHGSGESINARWQGEEMKRLDGGDSFIVHTHNVQCYSERWMRACQHPKFLDIAEAILGPDIILHHTKLFQKPSEKGSPFPMHQDYGYFPTEKDSMMAGIIHVSRATDEMGCLRVYPGSHKLGRMKDSMGQGSAEFLAKYPIENATILEAEPGDVLYFHYCTLHGSMPNRSPRTRKTVLVQLHAGDDAVEDGNRHPNMKLVLRGWNHRASRSNANNAG